MDVQTSHVFTSKPDYTPGGNDLVNTLQDEDELTGTAASDDVLNVVIGSVNDGAESLITPKLSSIENVNVEITGGASSAVGMSFQDAEGVEALNILRITANNQSVAFIDLKDSTVDLSLANATRNGEVLFNYAEGQLEGRSDEVNLTLNNVTQNLLVINQGDGTDVAEDENFGIETLNVIVNGNTNIDVVTVGANAEEDRVAGTAQAINIDAQDDLEINSLNVNGAEAVSIVATGDVVITGNERTNADANLHAGLDLANADNSVGEVGAQAGFNAAELETLTLAGAGNVTINRLSTNPTSGTNTVVINGAAMTTGDLAIRVGSDIALDEGSSLTSGGGNDEIIAEGGSEMNITTNGGNDTIRIEGDAGNSTDNVLSGTKDTISTGAGNDTVLVGFTDYALTQVPGTSDSYVDFDTAAGVDNIRIAGNQSGNINTGADNDTVRIGGNLDAQTVATESGDDSVLVVGDITVASLTTAAGADTITAATITGSNVNTGSEADSITTTGNVSGSALSTEAGDDTVSIGGNLTSSTISTADNNDAVTVSGNAEDSDLGLQGNTTADINLGTGADRLTVVGNLGADVVAGSDVETNNADGQDTIQVSGNMLGTSTITTQAGDDSVTITGELGVVRGDFVGAVPAPQTAYPDGAPVSEHNGAAYKQPGKTADNSHFDITEAAAISTGAGADTVATGSLRSAAQYNDNLIVGNGDADDTITIVGASITTAEGDDRVTLTQSDEATALVAEGASVNTGADNDTVTINMDAGVVLEADNAKTGLLTDREGTTAAVQNTAGALLTTGTGNDTITINGDMDSDAGADDLLVVDRGANLDGGAGSDSLTIRATDNVEVVASKAYIAVSGDNDDITDGSDIVMGGVNAEDAANGQGGYITGIETINLVAENSVNDTAWAVPLLDTSIANSDSIDDTPPTFDIDVEQVDTALQTLNLTANQRRELLGDTTVVNGVVVTDVAVGETGSTSTTGSFNNLYVARNATTFNVDNFRTGVELNLAAYEVNGVTGVPVDSGFNTNLAADIFTVGSALVDNCTTDVTVTVNMDAQEPSLATVGAFRDEDANRAFTLNLIANTALTNQTGEENYDVRIVSENQFMQDASNAVVQDADASDDVGDAADAGEDQQLDARYARDITINVTTGASHQIDVTNTFGNVNDAEWDVLDEDGAFLGTVDAVTAAEAVNMFADGDTAGINNDGNDLTQNETATSLTVNANTAGQVIAVENAHADTITLNGASNFFMNVDVANEYNITTGSGNDVVHMQADTVTAADRLNGGLGYDVLVVGAGTTDLTNVTNFEELVIEFDEGTTSAAAIDVPSDKFQKVAIVNAPLTVPGNGAGINDADTAVGVHTVNLTVTNVSGTKDALVIEADEDTANLVPDFCAADDNNRHSDQLVLNVNTTLDNASLTAAATDLNISVNVSEGTAINLTTDTAEDVAITATVSSISANVVNNSNGGNTDGELQIVTNAGDFESLTLDGDANNQLVTVTVSNTWAADNLFIDARQVTDAGNGNLFDGSAETNASLTIHGTTEDAATIEADGDDTIIGGRVNDFLFGEGGNDVIQGGLGVDTIDGGAGNDVIYGQLGADLLTGGAGTDTFVLGGVNGADLGADAASDHSDQASTDTITDFATGTDKLEINLGTVLNSADANFVDLSSFANVATVGDGDDSLAGTTTDRVQGDMYYTTANGGRFVMDVDGNGDITAQDISVNSANVINAADMIVRLNTGAGNDTVRLGQGVDIIDGGADDDTLVIVGSMGAAEIATYGADISDNGVMNTIADYGLTNVVDENELLVARSVSEANAGDTITGGAGTDTLHVFGNTNLTVVNGGAALNVEQLTIHSTVTMTDVQLAALDVVLFDDNTEHTLTIVDSEGNALTTDEINTIIEESGVVLQSADGAPVSVGGTLWYIGQTEQVEVTEDVSTMGEPNPVNGNVLYNENGAAGFNAISIGGLVVTDPVDVVTDYGTITFFSNGDFSYELDDAAVQELAEGETLLDQFAYNAVKVVDDVVVAKASTAFVQVTINGTTEIGTIDAGIVGASVTEASGVLNGVAGVPTVDADALYAAGDVNIANYDQFVVVAGEDSMYGSYTVGEDGVWEYTLNNDNAAVEALNVGDTLTDTIVLTSASDPAVIQEVTITINGANDAPTMELVEVTNNSVTLLAGDVDSTVINLVESLNGATALNNGANTTFVVEAQAAIDVTDLIATDGSDSYDMNTQVILGTNGADTFQTVPSAKDAVLFGFDGDDMFIFADDGVANTYTIADWAHGEDDGGGSYDERDQVMGSLGSDDVLNVIFDEASAQSVQGAPQVVAGNDPTPPVNDTVTSTSFLVSIDREDGDGTVSFTVSGLTAGETFYMRENLDVDDGGLLGSTGSDPALVTGEDYSYEIAGDTNAERVLGLLTYLEQNVSATVDLNDNLNGTYTFTITDTIDGPTVYDIDVKFDDGGNDSADEVLGTDGTVTFADHYDLGDVIYVDVGEDTAVYNVTTKGGVAGTLVASAIAAQIDGATVGDVDFVGVSVDGLVMTVNSDNSAIDDDDGLVSISTSIDEDSYQIWDGTGIDTADSSQRVTGSSGSDVIITGAGADVMTGGAGSDTFVFTNINDSTSNAMDEITDFEVGVDHIQLDFVFGAHIDVFNANDAIEGWFADYDEAYAFAASLLSDDVFQPVIASDGNDTWVFVSEDTHGASTVDTVIQLTGINGLEITNSDFNLFV